MNISQETKKETPRCNANVPKAKHGFFPNILYGYGPNVKPKERTEKDVALADQVAR